MKHLSIIQCVCTDIDRIELKALYACHNIMAMAADRTTSTNN
ncbi:hypothetical protein QF117_08880 [Vibrio sp. YMD68]|nr:hypothetical protein [Vibrio sp. YMD68]WGW00923.1 hypothetical protein QF117_08880 [Vibrio sp. YMD68]